MSQHDVLRKLDVQNLSASSALRTQSGDQQGAMMHAVAITLLLAWQPQPRRGQMPPARGLQARRRPIMQAGGAAAAKAMEMLGRMGMEAATGATPGEVPETKEFVATVTIRHARIIQEAPGDAGGTVSEYMQLPVDQYAIYDTRLMRRVEAAAGGDGETFELSVPTMRPQPGVLVPKPKLRVRVTPEPTSITLRSVGASLFGDDEDESSLPPNVTAAQMKAANGQLKDVFDLALNTTLAWSEAPRRAPGATRLKCRTDVRLKIRLPAPFTRVPRPVVQGAFGLVMKFVGNAILPRFAGLLESDYQRWCNGTRSLTRGLGSLTLDDDGYLVVPEEVLAKMKSAPGGRERLAEAGATLDIESSYTPDDEAEAEAAEDGGVMSALGSASEAGPSLQERTTVSGTKIVISPPRS